MTIPPRPARSSLGRPWIGLAVLVAAVASRFLLVDEWSLWEDEETSIYFSLNLARAFPDQFPLFFLLLRGVFELVGVGVLAGRILAASLGVFSIVLVYMSVARLVNREVAVLAAAFLILGIGHLFWSQSIRYYILLLSLQVVSIHLFLEGLETRSPGKLALVSAFLLLSVLTHLSAALLLPVFLAFIALEMTVAQKSVHRDMKAYLAFAIPFLAVVAFAYARFVGFQSSSLSTTIESEIAAKLPTSVYWRLMIQVAAYFGPPMLALSLAAPFVGRGVVSGRLLRFFICLAYLPLVELLLIARLNLGFPLWYQAFVASVGVAVLAGITLAGLRQRGHVTLYRATTCLAGALSLPLLVGYYTTMHGDRPRWKEAVELVRPTVDTGTKTSRSFSLYSTVPGVAAFYLGMDPSTTMTQSTVVRPPSKPPLDNHGEDAWFIVDHNEIPPAFRTWLEAQCVLVGQFEARTGPKNRTVYVYRRSRDEPGATRTSSWSAHD